VDFFEHEVSCQKRVCFGHDPDKNTNLALLLGFDGAGRVCLVSRRECPSLPHLSNPFGTEFSPARLFSRAS
jgi:hypothetical protein